MENCDQQKIILGGVSIEPVFHSLIYMSFAYNLQQGFFRDRSVADFWHLRRLVMGVLILFLPHFGFAEQENSAAPAAPALQSLTLEQAVKRVTRQSGGKILSARRIQTRKGPMFRIKVFTRTGRVRVVEIPEFEPPTSF